LIEQVIRLSLRHRATVILAAAALVALAGWLASGLKLDALPDLSEPQVIVKADFPGQPPSLVEDQVTYPLAAALVGAPGVRTVRAFSMFGESYAYVLFADGVDPYWARSRVLERMAQVGSRLPAAASLSLGPDASGTGWVFQYALVSKSGRTPIDRIRALQDFTVKQILQGTDGVSEVATFGGQARQLNIDVDPIRLAGLGLGIDDVVAAVRAGNQARGGGALEMGRQRFFVSTDARVREPRDLADAPLGAASGAIVRLGQVASVGFGPAPRDGVGDLDGRGDVVGGIVVMRQGENAEATSRAVEARLELVRQALPADVELVTTYDRADIIHAGIRSLAARLAEEGIVVGLVCAAFLGRVRSALVAIVTLPLGLLAALAVLRMQGVTANIMSLGGLAIAIGAMIDAAVVMVETLHRKMERDGGCRPRHELVLESALEVGPALFFSLLVITVSFLPVFSLAGQEGKLFGPLALTKTYAMAAAAVLAITVVPVLMGVFVRGRVAREHRNPLNRLLKRAYRPTLKAAMAHPGIACGAAVLLCASMAWPLAHMPREFMPVLDEGDLLYMPTTLPSVSVDEAADILRRTDAAIRSMPEVASVHGKAGRSDSATDSAPLSMFETTIRLKPRSQWPEPISTQALIARLDERVRFAGLTNSWGYPIRTRIDMLSSGVKTPLALRIAGPDLQRIERLGEQAESALRNVRGVRGVFAERVTAGRFIDVALDRRRADLLGVRAADLAQLLDGPVGGSPIDVMSVGRERYPVVVRFPRADRDSVQAIGQLRLRTLAGASIAVSDVADIRIVDGPTEIRSEDGRPVGYVLLDLADPDVGGVLARARRALADAHVGQPGYTLDWTGQYLRLEQASTRLLLMSLATLLSVVVLLQLHFGSKRRVALVLAAMPFAVAGGAWFTYLIGYAWSFATMVGFLALAGVAAEFCVVMILYLDQARAEQAQAGAALDASTLRRAVLRGALLRLRPKSMTVAVILGGLVPLMLSDGAGVDVMRRVAAPMLGGMITAPAFSLLIVPTLYLWLFGRRSP
jgi:copper/silver efflux system protein